MTHHQIPHQDKKPLALAAYRALVALDEPFRPSPPAAVDAVPQLVAQLVTALQATTPSAAWAREGLQGTYLHPRDALKALLTIRLPEPVLSPETHAMLDQLLSYERRTRATEALALPRLSDTLPQTTFPSAQSCALWQGDITTLRADAIVNAANAALLGCFEPFHACIDNAIHSAAGPRLREDCQRIMAAQGMPEPTGEAKITRAYHLPASFVLHTVGPIVRGPLQPNHATALAACYRACLDLAAQIPGVRSVAFCGISTGIYGYPKEQAARVALATVSTWLRERPTALDLVIFNVFSADDRLVYERLLEGDR
jgi:O-acetyl-ADP-ribose deacetylase (regulator of RNase III)